MGPAPGATRGYSPPNPPAFDPSNDLQEWRRDVSRWVETITAAAEKGNDRVYKNLAATLARHFYDRSLPSAQKSIVDEAQAKGLINYKQDDQITVIREIIELIAVDPPIPVVSRLIASFNKVTNCRRRRSEDLNTFVSRSRGLAADHLMHGGLSSSSQVGQVLAITLLNNASLSEETLTNAKLQLISLAQARESQGQTEAVYIPKSKIDELGEVAAKLGNMPSELQFRCFTNETLETAKSKIKKCRHSVLRTLRANQIESSIDATLQESTADLGERLLRPTPRCRLNLDDAVVVLRNLSCPSRLLRRSRCIRGRT